MSIAIESAKVAIYEASPVVVPGKSRLLEVDPIGNLYVNLAAFSALVFTTYTTGTVTAATGVLTVPAGKKWIVKSVTVSLTDASPAGVRRSAIQFQTSTGTVFGAGVANVTQGANVGNVYVYGAGVTELGTILTGFVPCCLSEYVMSAGMTINDISQGVQTGDTVAMTANVIELPA
jgi:hypothetical protein